MHYGGWTCDRPATVERDGKSYCWQHDPERLTAKRKERGRALAERAKKQDEELTRKYKRMALLEKAGITKLTDEDIENIIEYGGIHELIEYRFDREG